MLHWHTQTKKQIQSTNAYFRKTYFSNETFGGTTKKHAQNQGDRDSRNTKFKCYCPAWQKGIFQQTSLTLFKRQCIFSVMPDHHNTIFNPLRMDFVFRVKNFDHCNSKQNALHCISCVLFVADNTLLISGKNFVNLAKTKKVVNILKCTSCQVVLR